MADSQKEAKLIVSAEDKASRVLKAIGRELAGLGRRTGLSGVAAQFGRVRSAAGAVATSVRHVAFALGALTGISLAGLAASFKSFVDEMDSLNDVRKQVNMTGQQVRDLTHLFSNMGVEGGTVQGSLVTMTKGMGDLQAGTGRLNAFLKKAHPELVPLIKHAKDGGQAFEILVTAMRKMNTAGRAAFASKVFGNADMARIADMSAEEVRGEVARWQKLAGVVSDQTLEQADGFNDSWDQMKASIFSLRDAIGVELLPKMTDIANATRDWFAANREWIAADIGGAVKKIMDAIDNGKLQEFASTVNDVAQKLGGWTNVLVALAIVPLAGMIANVIKLGTAISGLGVALVANPVGLTLVAIAGAAVLINASWGQMAPHISAAGDAFKAAGANVGEYLSAVVHGDWAGAGDAVRSFVQNVSSGLGESLAAIGQMGIKLNEAVANLTGFDLYAWLPKSGDVMAKMGEVARAVYDAVSGIDLTAIGSQIIQSLIDGMTAKFEQLLATVQGWAAQIRAAIVGAGADGKAAAASAAGAAAGQMIGGKGTPATSAATPSVGHGASGSWDAPRAEGGPVRKGLTYLVGEMGPELFSPDRSGWITPHDKVPDGLLSRGVAANAVGGGGTSTVEGAAQLEVSFRNQPHGMGVRARKSGPLFKQISLATGPAMRPANA